MRKGPTTGVHLLALLLPIIVVCRFCLRHEFPRFCGRVRSVVPSIIAPHLYCFDSVKATANHTCDLPLASCYNWSRCDTGIKERGLLHLCSLRRCRLSMRENSAFHGGTSASLLRWLLPPGFLPAIRNAVAAWSKSSRSLLKCRARGLIFRNDGEGSQSQPKKN